MPPSNSNSRKGPAVVLAAAAMLIPVVALVAVGLTLSVAGVHQDRDAVQWMAWLDLPMPALWPSGSLQRFPQALPPAVDLRVSPFFDWQPDLRYLSETQHTRGVDRR